MKLFIFSLLIFVTVSVKSQIITDKAITVNPYLSFQNYEHFKRLTLSSPNSPIEYLEGFEFAWGYTYELLVRETELDEILSDGTRYDYTLLKIISKTKESDSTQFILFLDPNRYYYALDSSEQEMNITLKPINDSTFLYFDKVEIEVPANLRKKFNLIVNGKTGKLGKFIFICDKRIRLIHFEN